MPGVVLEHGVDPLDCPDFHLFPLDVKRPADYTRQASGIGVG